MCIRDSREDDRPPPARRRLPDPDGRQVALRRPARVPADRPRVRAVLRAPLPVSYTHLDVYKRQVFYSFSGCGAGWGLKPGGNK